MPWASNQAEDIKRVLANMGFNLGITRLLKFQKCLTAIEKQDKL